MHSLCFYLVILPDHDIEICPAGIRVISAGHGNDTRAVSQPCLISGWITRNCETVDDASFCGKHIR